MAVENPQQFPWISQRQLAKLDVQPQAAFFFPSVCSIAGLPGPGSGLKARIKYLKGPSRSRRSRCRSSGVTLASKMMGF